MELQENETEIMIAYNSYVVMQNSLKKTLIGKLCGKVLNCQVSICLTVKVTTPFIFILPPLQLIYCVHATSNSFFPAVAASRRSLFMTPLSLRNITKYRQDTN